MVASRHFALLTDFGRQDAYVAAMKGVILQLVPEAGFIDISHDVAAQDVAQGAELLVDMLPYLPRWTVVVAVVDPGVGTARRALIAECPGRQLRLLGPDNGLLWPALQDALPCQVHAIENPAYIADRVNPTFHGRDIFAVAASHLALGVPIARFGVAVDDPRELSLPRPERGENSLAGRILRADHYGNLISDVRESDLPPHIDRSTLRFVCGDVEVRGLHTSYGHAEPDTLLATLGGFGKVELAVRDGSAAQRIGYSPLASFPLEVRWD